MGIVHYVCEDCKKEVGFVIKDDIQGFGEQEVKVKGTCCNKWLSETIFTNQSKG